MQALRNTTRCDAVDVLNGLRLGDLLRGVNVHCEDLPVGLALINKAHSTKWPAPHHLANSCNLRGQVQDVQGIVVAGCAVELVLAVWVAEGLGEAAVVEGHRPAKGRQALGAPGVLFDGVLGQMGLDLELLQAAERHLVHIAVEAEVLIQPRLHVQVHIVPEGDAICRGRVVPRSPIATDRRGPHASAGTAGAGRGHQASDGQPCYQGCAHRGAGTMDPPSRSGKAGRGTSSTVRKNDCLAGSVGMEGRRPCMRAAGACREAQAGTQQGQHRGGRESEGQRTSMAAAVPLHEGIGLVGLFLCSDTLLQRLRRWRPLLARHSSAHRGCRQPPLDHRPQQDCHRVKAQEQTAQWESPLPGNSEHQCQGFHQPLCRGHARRTSRSRSSAESTDKQVENTVRPQCTST
mmetsp:Transcript_80152/g.194343  ORF Transcript_80152/g.194343 Transcript_80152/m.194343 type:complete len:404 (+) Transcript_80152:852-2063(+)